MSSSYSPDLRIELIGTGDQAGIWGNTTNTNLGTLLESAIAGYTSVSVITANQALTVFNGAADESRNAAIALTTTTVADFAIYAPPSSKLYTIYNASLYTATVYNSTVAGNTTAAGTGVAIPAGKVMTVWSDGTNFAQQNTHLNSPSFTTPTLGTPASGTLTNCDGLPVGTGISGFGSGVAAALAINTGSTGAPVLFNGALGTPASGTLTNATSLPIDGGTTGTLPVSRGGTGATTITSGALVKAAGTGAFSAASAADIVGQIGSTAVQKATTADNGGVTSVNTATGAVNLADLAAFGRSTTESGYQKLPGGFIVQWGTDGAASTITFPIAFPNACLNYVCQENYNGSGANNYCLYATAIYSSYIQFAQPATGGRRYIAIGY